MSDSHEPPVELVYKELDYRRGKQWDIFSWCSTILVTLTGGLLLLQTTQPAHPLDPGQKRIISFAVIVLVAYALLWLDHNARKEKLARSCFESEVSEKIWASVRFQDLVGHRLALVLLCLAALLATWYPWPFVR